MAAQPGGTAPQAQIPGYRVAGKTGTAHKIEGGQYARNTCLLLWGLRRYRSARLVIAVMIDEPTAGKALRRTASGPVFASIMGGSLRTMGVPQDNAVRVAGKDGGKGQL